MGLHLENGKWFYKKWKSKEHLRFEDYFVLRGCSQLKEFDGTNFHYFLLAY